MGQRIASIVLIAILISIPAFVGFTIGCYTTDSYWKSEAYRRGAATWEVSDDGSTTFKWILEPESEGE